MKKPIMLKQSAAILLVSLCINISVRAECERGWIPYKDESCIKAFTDLLTYDEAKIFCTSQENSDSTATLVIVKEPEMQELLVSYTDDKFDNFWLGSSASAQFKWEDGDPLTYTNWAEGFPRNATNSNSCIQFIPVNAKDASTLDGKWQDTACQRRNLAMCQRELAWSLKDAMREIQRLRKEFREELDAVNDRVVPAGSIYIEYFNQSSPVSLWPTLTWEDVTASYAGLFFRASGGGSESWGNTQANCAPQITQVQRAYGSVESDYNITLTLPSEGWSEFGHAGYFRSVGDVTLRYDLLRYNIKNCEVRPNNQAVRIWKRVA